jgi:putative transposase
MRALVDWGHAGLSIRRQCELLGLNRSTLYYRGVAETETNLCLMRLIDEQYLQTPFYGSRRMAIWLQEKGHTVNRKRVQRLMRLMGLEAIYPKPKLSRRAANHRIYPYLLRGLKVERPNQVWAADITYLPMSRGFMYLVAIVDWHSRYVLSWRLSNSLESGFCMDALDEALASQKPDIFNTDQGVQFTSGAFTGRLEDAGVMVSMDGRGRALDNVFVERLWWSLKYEHVYIHDHQTVPSLHSGLQTYLTFFNRERPHQSLEYRSPWDVYSGEHSVAGPLPRP